MVKQSALKTAYNMKKYAKNQWVQLWEELDGSIDAILEFARAAGLDSPEGFYNELNTIVFGGPSNKKKRAYLVEQANNRNNVLHIASELNRAAENMEKELGISILDQFSPGMQVYHLKHAKRVFTVQSVEDKFIVVRDKNNKVGFVFDPWNLKIK
jgi:hypothetical protein